MLYVDPIAQNRMDAAEIGVAGGARERKALEEFERLFLYEMLRAMRKTVSHSKLFGGESHRDMFFDMMDDAVAGEMAKSRQLGVANLVENQLRIQDRQATLGRTHNAGWDHAVATGDSNGLPLQVPASNGIPLPTTPSTGFPLKRIGAEYLELGHSGQGLPLRRESPSSDLPTLPINRTTGPEVQSPAP